MIKTMQVDIVSAEAKLLSAQVMHLVVNGFYGELGIYPGHTQLITMLKPGPVRLVKQGEEDEIFYISGGVLEVQPELVTLLADTGVRAADLDEAAALEAKQRAEHTLKNKQSDIDYAKATSELAQAVAQLQAIAKLRQKATGKR